LKFFLNELFNLSLEVSYVIAYLYIKLRSWTCLWDLAHTQFMSQLIIPWNALCDLFCVHQVYEMWSQFYTCWKMYVIKIHELQLFLWCDINCLAWWGTALKGSEFLWEIERKKNLGIDFWTWLQVTDSVCLTMAKHGDIMFEHSSRELNCFWF
jgi:hypothetical protein